MKRILVIVTVLMVFVCGIAYAAEKPAVGTGNIKGVVTWKYSRFVEHRNDNNMIAGGFNLNALGNADYTKQRGDSGAKIELIPVGFDRNSISDTQERTWYSENLPPAGTNIFVTEANNEGYYEINGIPAGDYMMFIVSCKAKADYSYPEKTVQRYIRNWDYFNTFVLTGGEYSLQKVTIQSGKTAAVNEHFEYTPQQGNVGIEK